MATLKAIAVLIAGLVAAVSWPALAQTTCVKPEQFIESAANASIQLVVDLRGEDAARFIEIFNRIQPATVNTGDLVMVFTRPAAPVLIFIFSAGCHLDNARMPPLTFMYFFPDIDLMGRSV